MNRIATIAIGDWSDDGHGKCSNLQVSLSGADVSNKSLNRAYKEAVKATGVDIQELFSEYEVSNIELEDLKKICDSGYQIHLYDSGFADQPIQTWQIFDEIPEQWYVNNEKHDDLISVGHMLMYYLGYGIENFTYEFMKPDYIIGRYTEDAPVSSFGYGFFS